MQSPNQRVSGSAWVSGAVAGALLGVLWGYLWIDPDLNYVFSLPRDIQEVTVEHLQRWLRLVAPPRRAPLLLLIGGWGGAVIGAALGAAGSRIIKAPLRLGALLGLGAGAIAALLWVLWLRRGIAAAVWPGTLAILAAILLAYLVGKAAELVVAGVGGNRGARYVLAAALIAPPIATAAAGWAPPANTASGAAPAAGATSPHRVLLIGIDAGAWSLLEPLAQAGRLPTLARWMETGAWGDLESTDPVLSPAVWTTIVTGVPPAEHGIPDFTRDGKLYTSQDRTAYALWEILPRYRLSSAFHFWWASWPATPTSGRIVTDRLLDSKAEARVYPAGETGRLERIAREASAQGPRAWDLASLGRDDPRVQQHRRAFEVLDSILARDRAVTALGVDALRSSEALVAVYLRAPDAAGHKFWRWHAFASTPRLARFVYGPRLPDNAELEPIVDRTAEEVDGMLSKLAEAAGPDTNIVVVSDHGMTATVPLGHEGEPTPETGTHHRAGMALVSGPDFRGPSRLLGATVYDVTPTILYLLDLPIPANLTGRVWIEAVRPETRALRPVRRGAPLGTREVNGPADHPHQTDETLIEQLRELGYVLD